MSTVLVVEDDIAYANLLVEYLTDKDLVCHAVHSGNDAIDWLEESACCAIITDIRMENGSGLDLIQWNSKGPQTPIMAMSGDSKTEIESTQLCEVLNIPFLSKPINFPELLELVQDKCALQKN